MDDRPIAGHGNIRHKKADVGTSPRAEFEPVIPLFQLFET